VDSWMTQDSMETSLVTAELIRGSVGMFRAIPIPAVMYIRRLDLLTQ